MKIFPFSGFCLFSAIWSEVFSEHEKERRVEEGGLRPEEEEVSSENYSPETLTKER